MSSNGQIVGGIVGAVIGYVVSGFNPYGAFQGAALGAGIGGYLDPPKGPTVSGPRLSDLTVQTSTYGAFIPRVYGTVGVHGNLLWLENNKLKETVRKEEQGGKGGGGSSATVKTYTYSATFAVAICAGPIAGIRRIWCGDKLIYNAGSSDIETIIASNKNADGWKVYLGTDDQQPAHRYQSDVGVNNASAFRGIAYVLFEDFELADYSNTLQVAQFKFEVVVSTQTEGVRLYDVFDNSEVTLDETASVSYSSNGILSIWFDPSDPRPFSGTSIDYRQHRYSISNGNFLGSSASSITISAPNLKTFNYPIGVSGKFSWSYHFESGLSSVSIFGTSDDELVTITPYPGDTNVGFGGCAIDNYLYVFRQRSDGSTYYEAYSGSAPDFSGEILNDDGSPYTRPIGNIEYYQTRGDVPVMESGGDTLWLLSPEYTSTPQTPRRIYAGSLVGNDFVLNKKLDYPIPSNQAFGSAAGGVLSVVERDKIYVFVRTSVVSKYQQPLSEIISSEFALSSLLSASDLDVSLITSLVNGYRVSGGSIRSSIEPLQGAFPFDVIQSGYKVKCVPRGQSSIATVNIESICPTENEGITDVISQSREMDSQLPARTNITYLDSSREYAESEQYAERINTLAINRVDRELPLVITANEAASIAEVLQNLAWLERNDFSFILPPTYLQVEPSDVITIDAEDAVYEVRITEANYQENGQIQCKAKPNRAALYSSNATGGEAPGPDGLIPLGGESLFVPIDIPVVDETIQNRSGFIGAMTGYTDSWPGALLIRTIDGGQTWADIQGFQGKASIARCINTLPVSSCTLIDSRSLSVASISGAWSSITRDQMLSGKNYAAYGADGRWEIVRYQNAELQVDGTYLISGFVRGDRGTEWASGLHQVDDLFIQLSDPDMAFIGSSIEFIGVPSDYRGVTSGDSYEDAYDVPFTYEGVNLKCLSPVYAKAARDGSQNLSATFTRRSRVSGIWWSNGTPTPVAEESESYEVDVMSGSTVKRTIPVTSPSFAYSAADQTTDFGSPQASITFRIYQISAVVGRGYALEVTL